MKKKKKNNIYIINEFEEETLPFDCFRQVKTIVISRNVIIIVETNIGFIWSGPLGFEFFLNESLI